MIFSTSPPLPAHVPLETFFRRELGSIEIIQPGRISFVTQHGWQGALYEVITDSLFGRRIIAADFRIGPERTVLYATVDSNDQNVRQDAIAALKLEVPRFRDNLTLDQLLCRQDATPLPTSSPPRFDEMRRTWSVDGVAFELSRAPALGRVEVKFAVFPRPPAAAQLTFAVGETKRSTDSRRYYGVTEGSEHFTLSFATGHIRERAMGAVYGSHHCVVIEADYALTDDPDAFRSFMCSLIRHVPLRGYPALRARAVIHAVPRGWAVRTRDLTTHLFAPDGTTCMTVLPAVPLADGDGSLVHKMLYEDVLTRVEFQSPITSSLHVTPFGLSAQLLTARGTVVGSGRGFVLKTAILSDRKYRYVVRYRDWSPVHDQVFAELIDSIEPVPTPANREVSAEEIKQLHDLFPVD